MKETLTWRTKVVKDQGRIRQGAAENGTSLNHSEGALIQSVLQLPFPTSLFRVCWEARAKETLVLK